jgi:hypothetical protein
MDGAENEGIWTMRGRIVTAGAALLAACGSGEPVNQAEPVAAPPSIVSTPTAPAVPVAVQAKPAAAIPEPFLGTYDISREDCARSSDGRLTVAPGELRFHESIGTVRKVTVAGADSVTVEADYQGEGESWRNVRELRLAGGGASLTIRGDGIGLTRIRCPAEAR